MASTAPLNPQRLLWLVLPILLAWAAPLASQTRPLVLEDGVPSYSPDWTGRLDYLEDPTGRLTLEQVRDPANGQRFLPVPGAIPRFGRSRSTYWLRFPLRRETPAERYLLIDYPVIGGTDLYAVPLDDPAAEPLDAAIERLDYRTPLFRLDLPIGEPVMLYLRAHNGKALLELPMRFVTPERLLRHTMITYSFFTAILVSLAVLALYNLFLAISLREPGLWALVGLILSAMWVCYRDANLIPRLEFLIHPDRYFYSLPLVLTIAGAFHFWRYIDEEENSILGWLCRRLPPLLLIALPLTGWLFSFEYALYLLAIALSPIALTMMAHAWINGHVGTRQNFLAAMVFTITAQPCLYHQAGIAAIDWKAATYIFQTGLLFSVLLLSLAQGARARVLKIHAERTEARNRANERFLTTMSHELRTPMNAILGYNTLLQKEIEDETLLMRLRQQRIASQHMMTLIDQILDVTRLKRRMLTLHHTPFSLDRLLRNIDDLFQPLMAKKQLDFTVHVPDICRLHLLGDATRLQQVLINLIDNALKFTEQGSVVIRVACRPASDRRFRLDFEVRDTGPGIPASRQEEIFEPFIQLDASTSRQHGGAGLGLALSHQLVALMGGTLRVDSETGEGCRFHFSIVLPATDEPATTEPKPGRNDFATAAPPDLAGIRTLLVDDDHLNRLVGHTLLESLGIRNEQASSAADALRKIASEPFDLVFMDISMPDMDGYEAARKIRESKTTGELPIVALTAHAFDGIRERCIEAGMNDCLTKPLQPETLIATIERHARRPATRTASPTSPER